ncbi:MAG: SGNH/GDSL hydrolase family protein [Lachnospiraceae bacterium]|nr:SGNH/GDSL hydrolase family protein [Lachnospiraceae bacterium]
MDIAKIDPNFKLKSSLSEPNIQWFDVRQEPFRVYGLYNYKEEPVFCRLPKDVADATNAGVAELHYHTAGGRVRFKTNSRYIALQADMPSIGRMAHMTHLGSAGFDLYRDLGQTSVFTGSFMPNGTNPHGYEAIVYTDGALHDYVLNFPLYSGVNNLYIGLEEGSVLCEGERYRTEKPIVYYGSSITQGGCASRPGNSYQGFISRKLDCDYINLGFSGSGRAEKPIVDYMSGLDMSVFVSDYDYNAPDAEYLAQTLPGLYETLRAKQPELPIILISKPDFERNIPNSIKRRQVIFSQYAKALDAGDQNIYYIDGAGLFRGDCRDACTVDGCHPNDLGFYRMADVIGTVLERILQK